MKLLHIKEKINDIITQEKDMFASGLKHKPLLSNRVQRIAIRLIVSFFVLIFVFTIVSRVSDSATIASVQVSTMTSGTLTNKAEIDGTIDAEDGISITLPEGLRVIKVNAERGKQVSEGEALLAFDVSSIKDKIKGLEDEIYILNQKISLSGKGSSDSVLDAQQALDDAQQAYERLVAKLERNDFADLESALANAIENKDRAITATRQAFIKEAEENRKNVQESGDDAVRAAQQVLSEAEEGTPAYDSAVQNLEAIKTRWDNALSEADEALSAAENRTDFSDEAAVMDAQAAIEAAESALISAQREFEDSKDEELYAAEKNIEAARRALKKAQENKSKSQTEAEIESVTYKAELSEKEKLRDTLKEIIDNGGHVMAPVSGTVLKTLEKGSKTEADVEVVTLSNNGVGFVFKGSLDKENAENFSVNDTGELSYRLDGSTQKLDVKIAAMGTADEDNMVPVTVTLPDGKYTPGMSAQLSLNKKSETYQNCLPLTALRRDSRGDHVLVIRKQNTVMGIEWVTSRVDIIVKDRDGQMMSIESTENALTYSDKVITSSNKTISEGDRVRIEG